MFLSLHLVDFSYDISPDSAPFLSPILDNSQWALSLSLFTSLVFPCAAMGKITPSQSVFSAVVPGLAELHL